MNIKQTQTQRFEISLKEDLSLNWQYYFGGLELETRTLAGKRFTVLKGQLDEAALQGVLTQIQDLNLHLDNVCTVTQIVQNVTPQKRISPQPYSTNKPRNSRPQFNKEKTQC